jgi:uncharacterized protein
MPVGILNLDLYLPGCTSLKEKRSLVKPLLIRLQREFSLSAAEVDLHDKWQSAAITCAIVSNDAIHNQRVLQQVINYIERTWPEIQIIGQNMETC